MRSLPSCMVRVTSAPSVFSNHCAIASGSGVFRWTWSQVYFDIVLILPL